MSGEGFNERADIEYFSVQSCLYSESSTSEVQPVSDWPYLFRYLPAHSVTNDNSYMLGMFPTYNLRNNHVPPSWRPSPQRVLYREELATTGVTVSGYDCT